MYQYGFAVLAYPLYGIFHSVVRICKITSIQAHTLHPFKPCSKLIGIHGACLIAAHRYAPVIVLHEVNNRQLMQNRKLERFTNLSLRNTAIAQRTYSHRR